MASAGNRVVVLIITHQEYLSEYEKVSLQQCLKILKNHPIKIVKPKSADISSWNIIEKNVQTENFPDHCFSNIGTYSRLLVSGEFYRRFEQFDYLLLYQLDAFVFRDELLDWCNKGYDYVGAPWFEKFSNDKRGGKITGVGNGGLSLRKVSSHLKVLRSFSYLVSPNVNWQQRFERKPTGGEWLHEAAGFLLDLCVRNNTFWLMNSFKGFEDQFWGLIAAKKFKWFTVPSGEEAMKFSFEMQPRRLYELNNNELPFGCHAWWKYDFEFWKPYIENCGYHLPDVAIETGNKKPETAGNSNI